MPLKLAIELKEREITDTALSGLTNISPSDISKLKRGLIPAYPGWRRRIARVMGMSEEDLFAEVDDDSAG